MFIGLSNLVCYMYFYILPIYYQYYYIYVCEDETFIGNFIFIIFFMYTITDIIYPLLCHDVPFMNHQFIYHND